MEKYNYIKDDKIHYVEEKNLGYFPINSPINVIKKTNKVIDFIKQEWPAIIASVLFGIFATLLVELGIWEYIKGTF